MFLFFVYLMKVTNMYNPTIYNFPDAIKAIHAKEEEISALQKMLAQKTFELQEMKRRNAATITIQWKESIFSCLEVDENTPEFFNYFLKTPAFISDCVAWNCGVDTTRDLKNKIASTLSFMFSKGQVGRIQQNGKTYYGLPKYFNKDLVSIKPIYMKHLVDLAA